MRISLISGLWPTNDSNGFEGFAGKLRTLGHECTIYKYTDKAPDMFDVSIRHSFGANQPMQHLKYLALIEPVRFWWSQEKWQIPSTVLQADCWVRKGWRLPPSVQIGNPNLTYINYYIDGLDHGNAPRNLDIQSIILNSIRLLS